VRGSTAQCPPPTEATPRHDAPKLDPVAILRTHFPALEFRDVRVVNEGWDSLVLDLDGEWIVRFPRRPEVEQWVERKIALLPALAPTLPVAVPRFDLVGRNGVVCVGYRKLAGWPAGSDLGEPTGRDLAHFLSAAHRFPVERATALGVPCFDLPRWRERFGGVCAEFRRRVFPLFHPSEREPAATVFARVPELYLSPHLERSLSAVPDDRVRWA